MDADAPTLLRPEGFDDPGRPPPTIVRRTAWEFAGLIVANSGELAFSGRRSGRATETHVPYRFYPLRDYC